MYLLRVEIIKKIYSLTDGQDKRYMQDAILSYLIGDAN
jgi:hypothetical protein